MRDFVDSRATGDHQTSATSSGKRKRSLTSQASSAVTPPKRQSLPERGSDSKQSANGFVVSGSSFQSSQHKTTAVSHSAKSSDSMYALDQRLGNGNVIDLTSPGRSVNSGRRLKTGLGSSSQPRKLVVKNLRAESTWDVEKYLAQTWNRLDAALTQVLNNAFNIYSIEEMYRGVEGLCRQGKASTINSRLNDKCLKHLREAVLPSLPNRGWNESTEVLQATISAWHSWKLQLQEIRRMFYYLDRSYLLQHAKPSLEDAGIQMFRDEIFNEVKLKQHITTGVCHLIAMQRSGRETDKVTLSQAIGMFHELAEYTRTFEPHMLETSQIFLATWAEEMSAKLDVGQYVKLAKALKIREEKRCDDLELDSSTKRDLIDSIDYYTIRLQVEYLTSAEAVAKLLEADVFESLCDLYGLLKRTQQTSRLKAPFMTWTEDVGTEVCFDEGEPDGMVVRLLSLKRRLDSIWRIAFCRDDELAHGLRDAFTRFINKTKRSSATWDTDNSKTGEMIAKYVDLLLKGSVKAIPNSYMANDVADKEVVDDDEHGDVDEDHEIHRQLEQVLDLFRFLRGKAVFEAFYKRDLAKRLLMGRSASADAEQSMLGRLKTECGEAFTQNLEQMFKDIDLSRDELSGYKERLERMARKPGELDLDVNILSAAAWPSYPDVTVHIPSNVKAAIDEFERYYKTKHSGRRLAWKHALANCQLKASFPKGSKMLVVSSFQAVVLLLFNGVSSGEHLTYEQIRSESGLSEAEVKRTLQSLACSKLRPLTKSPQGREIDDGDKFAVNLGFSHPKYRVRINQIQLKETKEENKETHERVAEDRNFDIQAAIVRTMKSRKNIGHSELIAEVIKATQSRGVVAVPDIKRNIDRLIEKDYMEREEGNTYNYVA